MASNRDKPMPVFQNGRKMTLDDVKIGEGGENGICIQQNAEFRIYIDKNRRLHWPAELFVPYTLLHMDSWVWYEDEESPFCPVSLFFNSLTEESQRWLKRFVRVNKLEKLP